jgi:hypothetical protein
MIICRCSLIGYWLFHCHVGWHMEMGMSVAFNEASELVGAPPADYGMCGADGTYGAWAALLAAQQAEVDIIPSSFSSGSDQDSKAFTITVSLLAVVFFALLVLAAGFWLASRKWKGLFHRVDLQAGTEAVENPLTVPVSSTEPAAFGHAAAHADVESGGVQMTSLGAGTTKPINGGRIRDAAGHAHDDEHHDDLEEISFSSTVGSGGYTKGPGSKLGHGGDVKVNRGAAVVAGVGGAVSEAVGAGAARVDAGLRGLRRSISRVVSPEK